jgi:TonB family protein
MILSSIFIFTEKRKPSEQLSYAPVTQQSKDLQTLNNRTQTETKPPTAVPVEKKEEEISAKNRELIRVAVPAEPVQFSPSEKAMSTKSVRAGKTSDTVMEFKPDSSAVNLNEIVVVGYGARGAGDEAEEAMNEYTPPHPVNGRADFDKYIRENIRRPDTTTTGQRAVVVLNFNVNAEGKIDSIRIIRSPGKIFSDEAIRLIKEGPEWKPAEENGNAISDEVRIRIVFK